MGARERGYGNDCEARPAIKDFLLPGPHSDWGLFFVAYNCCARRKGGVGCCGSICGFGIRCSPLKLDRWTMGQIESPQPVHSTMTGSWLVSFWRHSIVRKGKVPRRFVRLENAGAVGNEIRHPNAGSTVSQHSRSSTTSYSQLCLRGNDNMK